MARIVETAWAKINLALHVTGQREDGYHLIDSLVTFADFGDMLSITSSEADSISIDGEFGNALAADRDNLVAKARDHLRRRAESAGHAAQPVSIHLLKNLPVASGIGGGSADAAACLRGLMRFWHLRESLAEPGELASTLGADVPMCMASRPLIAGGIGERVEPADYLPALPLVLVNPLVSVSTPESFARLARKDNAPLRLEQKPASADDLIRLLRDSRNDLEGPATTIAPVIGEVMAALRETKPLFHRMSGSGATCFAIFETLEAARLASERLRDTYLEWWVRECMTRTASDCQLPESTDVEN